MSFQTEPPIEPRTKLQTTEDQTGGSPDQTETDWFQAPIGTQAEPQAEQKRNGGLRDKANGIRTKTTLHFPSKQELYGYKKSRAPIELDPNSERALGTMFVVRHGNIIAKTNELGRAASTIGKGRPFAMCDAIIFDVLPPIKKQAREQASQANETRNAKELNELKRRDQIIKAKEQEKSRRRRRERAKQRSPIIDINLPNALAVEAQQPLHPDKTK